MAFKVNYGLERAERNRAKQAKKEAKTLARKQNAGSSSDGETSAEDDNAGAENTETQKDVS